MGVAVAMWFQMLEEWSCELRGGGWLRVNFL